MTRIKHALLIVGALLLISVVAAVFYLSFADLGYLRPRIESAVADATGRELRIAGELSINALPTPSVVATDVTFSNASWGAPTPMVSAGRLGVEVGLWSLISGPIRVKQLELHDVSVLLEQNAAGERNWVLAPSAPEEPTDSAQQGLPVIVELGSVSNVEVLLRRPDSEDLVFALSSLELRTDEQGIANVDSAGRAADVPFTLRGTFTPDGANRARFDVDAAIADAPLHAEGSVQRQQVDFSVSAADLSRLAAVFSSAEGVPAAPLDLTGTFALAAERFELRDAVAKLLTAEARARAIVPRAADSPIEIDVALTSPDISELVADLPALALTSSAKAKISPERIDVDSFDVELGDSDIAGSAAVAFGDVLAITAKAQSELIDLTPFQTASAADGAGDANAAKAAATPADGATASEWIFVEDELPFERLRALDLSAELTAGEIKSRDASARNFALVANGKGGKYDVETSFEVADGGEAEGHFVLGAAGDRADVDIDVAARGLLVNIASGEVEDPSQIPPLGFSAKLRSTGKSPRALASAANGRLTFTQGAGRIDNGAIGLASGDIFAQIFSALNPFSKDEEHSNWDCTVVALDIVDGVGEIVPMLGQGEKLLIVGTGNIDLKTEKLDVEFNTKPRSGVGVTADMFVTPFVKLSGTLAKPGVGMNASGTLLAGGAAALTGGISVLVKGIADRATAEADQCADALAQLDSPETASRRR